MLPKQVQRIKSEKVLTQFLKATFLQKATTILENKQQTKHLQTYISGEHKCEISQQNASTSDSTNCTSKRLVFHSGDTDMVEYIQT